MITRRSREEIAREIKEGIIQETSINMVGRGSVTHALANAIATPIEKAYDSLDTAVSNSYLSVASGFFLDLLGESYGILRKQPTAAFVLPSDRIIKFYVRSGSLAAKAPHPTNPNLGRIPSGTQIYGQNGITFIVDENTDFPAAAKLVYVGASSSGIGISQNVGVGALSTHDLSSTEVLVTNEASITSGIELESDEEYRFRISKWITSSAGKNETSIRMAVLSATGVADMIRIPYHLGAGSFKIVVIPSGNILSSETIRQVYANVQAVVSEGTFFQIVPPRYVRIGMTVRLIPNQNNTISATERELAQQAILAYIGNIRPGKTLVINQLKASIFSTSTGISDLSIQAMLINGRPNAIVNFSLARDELLVPDNTLDDPILVV